jgi:uncharacterized protein YndB with AHSA1/START domain
MLRIRPCHAVVEVSAQVAAPIEHVFERITDHEAMVEWPGISACALIVEGAPRNGLGAIRRITASGLTLDEQVVTWEPPGRYEYRIIRGLPVKHLGTVRLRAHRGGTEVVWRVELRSRVPLVAELVGAALRVGLGRALRYFSASFAN